MTVFIQRWCCTLMLPSSAAGRLFVRDLSTALAMLNIAVAVLKSPQSFPGDVLNGTQNIQYAALGASEIHNLPQTLRKRCSLPCCTTFWIRSQATKRTRRTVNQRAFFSSAEAVTPRETFLSLAKIMKTWAPRQCQRRVICQQPDIFQASNDDSWKQRSFDWFLPRSRLMQPDEALEAPRFAGEKVISEALLLIIAPEDSACFITLTSAEDWSGEGGGGWNIERRTETVLMITPGFALKCPALPVKPRVSSLTAP